MNYLQTIWHRLTGTPSLKCCPTDRERRAEKTKINQFIFVLVANRFLETVLMSKLTVI